MALNDLGNVLGPQGATGPQGPTGATGPQGPTGSAASIQVGTVTTGAAGSNASVTNVGTTSAAKFNFTIPRGNTGATGPQGPQGADGVLSILTGTKTAAVDASSKMTIYEGTDNIKILSCWTSTSNVIAIATSDGSNRKKWVASCRWADALTALSQGAYVTVNYTYIIQ